MTPAELLNASADLIERTGWTQGEQARDDRSNPVSVFDDSAACFCMIGSMRRFSRPCCGSIAFIEAAAALRELLGSKIVDWNDTPGRTKEEVIAAMRAAAKGAK